MKEHKIMRMDWRPLGYWPVYKDGKLEWEAEGMCNKCGMNKEHIEYWDTHQTMSDYKVWCTK
jgi:hypothetical protein